MDSVTEVWTAFRAVLTRVVTLLRIVAHSLKPVPGWPWLSVHQRKPVPSLPWISENLFRLCRGSVAKGFAVAVVFALAVAVAVNFG